MKQLFLKKEGNPGLLLFFAGWGADEHLFASPVAEGYDCMLCYDYASPAFEAAGLAGYRSIRLLGWSMGVWAAAEALASLALPYEKKIAVNGTPFPINDAYGIPVAIFEGTLKGFSDATLARFRRRMCGSAEACKCFLAHAPRRSSENLQEELTALERRVTAHPDKGRALQWDEAWTGSNDRIFPPDNQVRAWNETGTPTVILPMAHYDADCFARLIGENSAWIKH